MRHTLLSIIISACCSLTMTAQESIVLTQQECRQMALQNNEDMKSADNKFTQAELDKYIAFTNYFPRIDASATGAYVSDIEITGMELQMRGMYMAGITLTQPIYAGGQIMAGNKIAKIGKECAEENRKKTRMQIMADADKAYWTYITVQKKVDMLESYMRQMDTLYTQVETGLRAGMSTENDLLRIKAKRSEIKYQLQKAVNGQDLCRLSLCNVLGKPLDTQIMPADTVITVTAPGQLDENIETRPEFNLMRKQIEAEQQQIKMARSEILPKIGLSAGYMYYGNVKMTTPVSTPQGSYNYTEEFKDGISLAMLSVSIPLVKWGEGLKKIKKAKLNLENARLDFQKNRRLLSIQARQAVQNLTDGYNMIETAQIGYDQACENLRVMKNRYDNSMSSLTDLLDAQSQWHQAQSNLLEAKAQYMIYKTEYQYATGKL